MVAQGRHICKLVPKYEKDKGKNMNGQGKEYGSDSNDSN
jgi:hypothetical protein